MKSRVIWIKPRLIPYYCLPPYKQSLKYVEELNSDILNRVARAAYKWLSKGIVFGGDWDLRKQPLHQHPTYKKMTDLLCHISDIRESSEFKKALAQISNGSCYQHKSHVMRTEAELEAFFQGYFVRMMTSMRESGYVERLTIQYPGVLIGRDGEVIKSRNGRHRFFTAVHTCPDKPFPFRVDGFHRYYLRSIGVNSVPTREVIDSILSDIEMRYQGR